MSHNYLRRLYVVTFCLLGFLSYGQEILITQGGTVATCSGSFLDGGGINGDHSARGTRQVITLCSDNSNPENTHIELTFSVIDIRGTLTILNGNSESAPVLTEITANNNSDRITVSATAANASGCLTVVFESNGNKAGWEAGINCVSACQPIIAQLASSTPAVTPSPGGYLDVCVGDEIVLTATASYPENNARYPQSDARSTFRWDFQDGTSATGRQVTKVFTEPGGYIIDLDITDEKGCSSQNNIAQRVRVSAPPDFGPDSDAPLLICPGETVTLGLGDQTHTDVNFDPRAKTSDFTAPQPFSDRIDIPDQAGTLQSSSLVLRDFDAGQVLTSGDGIVEICVELEHSYAGDISMWIECPNGRRVDFLQYDPTGMGATNQRFGQPDANGSETGNPFTYCWSAKGLYTVPFYARTFLSGPGFPSTIPPEVTYLPLDGSFDAFAGCPLNGEWTLNVIDNQVEDNGTVFSWSITFADNLVSPAETFTIPLVSAEWADSGIHSDYSPQRITYTGANPGFANQRLTTLDSLGCQYDTLVPVFIRSPYSPVCFSCPDPMGVQKDTTVCEGTSFRSGLVNTLPNENTPVRWEAYTDLSFKSADARPDSPYQSVLRVADQLPATVTDPASDMGEVCIDLTSNGDLKDVEVSLVSPGGTVVVVVPRGSVSGTSLQQCYTPDDSPRWAVLRGARINGDWTLRLSDSGGNNTNKLTAWSLDFVRKTSVTYSWSPQSPDLSCTDCPDPLITPTRSDKYFLTVRNSDGCTSFASIDIEINPFSPAFTAAYTVACRGEQTGGIDLTPTTPLSDVSYAWSTGATTQDLSGIPEGTYSLTVTGQNGCTSEFTYDLEFPSPLSFSLDRVADVTCAGSSDGSIRTTTTGGIPPYRYRWSEADISTDGNAGALQAGTYSVTVTDSLGCSDSLSTRISEPAVLAVDFVITPVSCRNGEDGAIAVSVIGGSGDYAYEWNDGSTMSQRSGLSAGDYILTVTDGNGCFITDSAFVSQPDSLLDIDLIDAESGCFDTSGNKLSIHATGGSAPYTYAWSNGETDATANRLPAGDNTVTVTDATGCFVERTFTTESRPALAPVIIVDSENSCDPALQHYLTVTPTFATYRWSTGDTSARIAVSLSKQNYSVTVTDQAGCTAQANFQYTPPKPVTFDLVTTSVSCFGARDGELMVTNLRGPSGPLEGYSLNWGPGADFATGPVIRNRPAGTYLLTLTDSTGCGIDTNLVIPTPDLLAVVGKKTDISCTGENNGTIATTVTGGTGTYSFAWSTGSEEQELAGLSAGGYTVTVTDQSGCQATAEFTLLESSPISVEATTLPANCGGEASGRIDIAASGGREPLSYSIDNINFSNIPSLFGVDGGTYTIYVRDAVGCTGQDTITVENRPALSVELGDDVEIVFGDSLTLQADITNAIGQIDYRWSGSYDGTLSCADCPNPVVKPPYEITYAVSVMDEMGCEAEDRFRVKVRKIREVVVPTGFSPNGDGRNDLLLVHGRPGTRVIEFTVYDRWGGVLYQDGDFAVNQPVRGWDGTARDGTPIGGGVYLYKLRVEHEDLSQETLSGQTTLIR